MFGIKGRDTFNRPHSSFEEKIKKMWDWWVKYFSYVLLIFFLVAASITIYIWYQYLYDKDVPEQEKQDYIIQKSSTIKFKKDKFEAIETELKQRKEAYDAPRKEYEDIFYGNIETSVETEEEKPVEVEEESQETQASLFTPTEEGEDVE
jgi:hypothetical protein